MKKYFVTVIFIFIAAVIILNSKSAGFRKIIVNDFNNTYEVYTEKNNVKEILEQIKISVNKEDLVYPEISSELKNSDTVITVCRVNTVYKNKIIPINQKVINVKSRALPEGKILETNPGSKGYREETYKIVYINGQKIREECVDIRLICRPRNKIILQGVSEKRRTFKDDKLPKFSEIELLTTAYSPEAASCAPFDDGYTAIGLLADYGIIAVDPSFIPLGTLMYVEGYGYAIAADVGSAINNNDADLCFKNHRIALEYGVKTAKAYVLE